MGRKRWQIAVVVLGAVGVLAGLGAGLWLRLVGGKFEFEADLYGRAELIEINAAGYEELVAEGASFGMLVYQPLCTTSYEFTQVVTEFMEAEQVSFYKIPFSQVQETALATVVKYYPSFVLVREGEVVKALDANSDADTEIYKSEAAFREWVEQAVRITGGETSAGDGAGDEGSAGGETGSESDEGVGSAERTEVALDDVVYDAEKVNVYFFWGDGCAICEREWKFWRSVETEYGDYFTLNAFEVWKNDENAEIMQAFAAAMGDELKGVPYTVIGERTFKGFTEETEEAILTAIREQYRDSYDVYFEELKGE